MKIYVGYISYDYAHAVCVSFSKSKVEQYLAELENNIKWLSEYDLNKDTIAELECD